MHVIAGSAKGRRLLTPKDHSVRPTSGRVKEALFSILQVHVPGARFLDLFAGTGAIGIEAISRGAAHVIFVEPSPSSLRLLRQNVERCGMAAQATIAACAAVDYLAAPPPGSSTPFDLVFADPPYQELDPVGVLSSLDQSVILQASSIVILEHATSQPLPAQIGRLVQRRQYRYGDTSLTRFERLKEGPSAP